MGPLDGPRGPRGPPWPVRVCDYSRATTATLGDDVAVADGPGLLLAGHLRRPSAVAPPHFLDAVNPRKPSTPHMQLFVLGCRYTVTRS